MDVLAGIRASKMTPLQIRAIAIALALIILDGFEIAVMSFAAKPMSDEWGVTPGTLGIVLSGSLFGMAAGAILFSPFGDRYGRRPLTIVSMSMVVVGMVLAVLAPNVATMIVARVVTGFGIGAMSQLNAYVSEFASEKRRGTVVGIYATGFPIGAALAGVVAGFIDPENWKILFVVGTVLSVILLVIAWAALPESVDFLVARRPKNALDRVNAMLEKMGHPALTELPSRHPRNETTPVSLRSSPAPRARRLSCCGSPTPASWPPTTSRTRGFPSSSPSPPVTYRAATPSAPSSTWAASSAA